MNTQLSLDTLQESYDKSNTLYWNNRWAIDRLSGSHQKKVEEVDFLTGNLYRKLKALEEERRRHFSRYYADRKISCYPIEAVHVGEIGGTEFTEQELKRLAKSLSFNRLNINHAEDPKLSHLPYRRALDYPSNQTLELRYDSILEGITGFIQVEDAIAKSWIESGKIYSVSIEYLSLGGSDGLGIVGTGLALVTSDVKAADNHARIYRSFQS